METIEQIKIDEGGYQAEVYLCSEGKLTWLYGRNIEDRPITPKEWSVFKRMISEGETQKDWSDWLFDQEITTLIHEMRLYNIELTFKQRPEEATNIIINMLYNMGISRFNPGIWPKFFKAIKEKDWKQAATEGRDSKWFYQVGQRSIRLMNSLENIK